MKPSETELNNISKILFKLAYGYRDDLLYKVFKYFKNNNLPINDLAVIAGFTSTRLYQIISRMSKKEASK